MKDQLYRIDETFDHVQFAYRPKDGAWVQVHTLEEDEWPEAYHALDLSPEAVDGAESAELVTSVMNRDEACANEAGSTTTEAAAMATQQETALKEGLVSFRENQRGVSYDTLFGPYLEGAERVEIIDPYVRTFHQCRNVMELMGVLIKRLDYTKASPRVHLITAPDMYGTAKQEDYLGQIRDAVEPMDIDFTWEISDSGIHARHLRIDDRWDILLDRGLDIWQKFDSGNAFALESQLPEMRRVKQFEVIYMKV